MREAENKALVRRLTTTSTPLTREEQRQRASRLRAAMRGSPSVP